MRSSQNELSLEEKLGDAMWSEPFWSSKESEPFQKSEESEPFREALEGGSTSFFGGAVYNFRIPASIFP